jgi:DNA-binding response OmpR family regulator
MRILIAEDDFTSRITLTELLKKQGHDVVATVNGLEALELLRQPDAPMLAILDWLMPELDGAEVVRQVRALKTDRPPYLIMLTVRGEKADIICGLTIGANDYLPKPFDPGELCARVEVGRRMLELQDALASKVEELLQALKQIKTLRGILPICANCKNIRDDQGLWHQLEEYINTRTDAEFSHGICPACTALLYPDSETAPKGSTPE